MAAHAGLGQDRRSLGDGSSPGLHDSRRGISATDGLPAHVERGPMISSIRGSSNFESWNRAWRTALGLSEALGLRGWRRGAWGRLRPLLVPPRFALTKAMPPDASEGQRGIAAGGPPCPSGNVAYRR